jgi:hypothetical protein
VTSEYYYVLDAAGQPQPAASVEEWGHWYETASRDNASGRRIGWDEVGDASVSTVFLGLNHAFGGGPPLLFETMVFGGQYDQWLGRWTTRAGAEAAHARIVNALRDGREPESGESRD